MHTTNTPAENQGKENSQPSSKTVRKRFKAFFSSLLQKIRFPLSAEAVGLQFKWLGKLVLALHPLLVLTLLFPSGWPTDWHETVWFWACPVVAAALMLRVIWRFRRPILFDPNVEEAPPAAAQLTPQTTP